MSSETQTVWQLARLAECMEPDTELDRGGLFLQRVAADYRDRRDDDSYDEDTPHEIADIAVPAYTHERWQVFVDLGAYQEDVSELGATGDDLTQCAAVALYMIAERLVRALAEEDDIA